MTGGAQPCCASKDNRGWRYFIAAIGVTTLAMFVARFFLFNLMESPKFLLSRNRQADAVEVVQAVARYNGSKTWLDQKTLQQLAGEDAVIPGLTMSELGKRNLSKFSGQKLQALFDGWRLGTTTILIWVIWLTLVPLFCSFD